MMFEKMRFLYHYAKMKRLGEQALKARIDGNCDQAYSLSKRGLAAGYAAAEVAPATVRIHFEPVLAHEEELYQRLVRDCMPKEDRELVGQTLQWFGKLGVLTVGDDPVEQVVRMFDLAKSRLSSGTEVLHLLYDSEQTPAPLRDIMVPFIMGEVSQQDTEQRLDAGAAAIRKWVPELLPKSSLSA